MGTTVRGMSRSKAILISGVLIALLFTAWGVRGRAAGATLKRPVENQFYGDRLGSLVDPFGHLWHVSTHVEDVSPEEIARRAAAMAQQHKP